MRRLAAAVMIACACPAQATHDATGTITGTVVDGMGEPVPAAEVWCSRYPHFDEILGKGRTDGQGYFVLSDIPPGSPWAVVQATAPGCSRDRDYATIRSDHLHDHVRIRLWDAAPIRGRVVDGAGEPVPGALVSASNDHARVFGAYPIDEARTDEQGRFTLSTVALGEIQIRAWADGYVTGEAAIWHTAEREGVEVSLRRGKGVTLAVHVEGLPDGASATAHVIAYGKGGLRWLPSPRLLDLGPGGNATFSGLTDLEYQVSILADGYSFTPRRITVKPGEKAPELRFSAVADQDNLLRGILTDRRGNPLAGERLICRASSGGRRVETVTDAEGKFELRSPRAPGESAVLYLADSLYVTAQEQQDDRYDARDLSWHEFTVDPQATIKVLAQPRSVVSGIVVDEQDRPVATQRVTLQEARPGRTPLWMAFQYGMSDRSGRFRFSRLNPPDRDIRVTFGGESTGQSTEPFRVAVGESVEDVELVVARPGETRLSGVVRDEKGEPVAGARVWLRNWDFATGRQASGSVIEVLSGRAGRYCFPNIDPGGHWIQVYLENDREALHTEPFEVAAGKAVEMSLEVRRLP